MGSLTTTRQERRQLLRNYFEPNKVEREAGLKLPTKAHHASARLVPDGRVRHILTTNFDRLTEAALRSAGIEGSSQSTV